MAAEPSLALLRHRPWRLHWPLLIPLADGASLRLERALLWKKGRYLSCAGFLDGQPVAVLWLVSRRAPALALRHLAALNRLAGKELKFAPLLRHEQLAQGELLVFAGDASHWPLMGDDRLDAAFVDSNEELQRSALARVMENLGRLHAQAVSLADPLPLTLGSMDADTRRPLLPLQPLACLHRRAASRQQAELAELLATVPPRHDDAAEQLLQSYRQAGGKLPCDLAKLIRQRQRARRQLLSARLADAGRESWGFAHYRSWRRTVTVARHREPALADVLADPQAAMRDAEPLKLGTSNTVVRADARDGAVVIKRYNMKTWLVRLKRLARASRPEDAWRAIHAFRILGIATAAPQALIRAKQGVFYGLAWMVNDYVEAPAISVRLQPCLEAGNLPPDLARQLRAFFAAMHAATLSHGDLKHRNLLWPETGPLLIDMDAACYHGRAGRRFQRAWSEDRRRFLANWPEGSPLREQLDTLLPGEYRQ